MTNLTTSRKRRSFSYSKMKDQEGYIKLNTKKLREITGMTMVEISAFLGITRMSIYLALQPNRTIRCEAYSKIRALVEQKLAEKKEKTND